MYETYLVQNGLEEENVKKGIVDGFRELFGKENIKKDLYCVERFGEYLKDNRIHNIITTNYDEGLEVILEDICCYEKVNVNDLIPEKIYSIRTYKKFVNHETGHEVKLWKIHGDMERTKSIILGFDQYCGSLSKLSDYIKGNYTSKKGPQCNITMIEKCQTKQFDNLSWAELFFNTNVYIVGLGLDFCEIDIWWLLNKHMRIKKVVPQITNDIYYLYNEKYDNQDKKADIFEALRAFEVNCVAITSDNHYLQNIFEIIANE